MESFRVLLSLNLRVLDCTAHHSSSKCSPYEFLLSKASCLTLFSYALSHSGDMVQLTNKAEYSYTPGEFDIDIGDDLSQTSVSVDGASVKVKTEFRSGPMRPENTYVSVGEKSSFAGAINYEEGDTRSIPGAVDDSSL